MLNDKEVSNIIKRVFAHAKFGKSKTKTVPAKPEDAELDATNKQNLRKIANCNYYSSNQSNGQDYLNYIEDGVKQSGDFDYLDYVGVHEK